MSTIIKASVVFLIILLVSSYREAQSQPAGDTRLALFPLVSIDTIFACDNYALYFSKYILGYCTEIRNPTDSNLILRSVESNSGSRLPFIWGHPEKSILLPSGKSVLAGLIDSRMEYGRYDLLEYLQEHPRFQLYLLCNFVSLPQFNYSQGSNSVTLERRVKASEILQCPAGRIDTSWQLSGSLQVDADLYDFIIRRRSIRGGEKGDKIVLGLIRIYNPSGHEIVVEGIGTNDPDTRFLGLPEWMRNFPLDGNCTSVTLPPHTCVAFEYECNALSSKFNGDVDLFLDKGYSFQVMVKVRGGDDPVLPVPVSLHRKNIRMLIEASSQGKIAMYPDIAE